MFKKSIVPSFIAIIVIAIPNISGGIILGGPITANSVSVSGNVTVSSMTASTMTVTNLLQVNRGISGIKGLVVQTKYSSTSSSSTTTSTTLTAIPQLSTTITLLNAEDYVRISLTGMLQTSYWLTPARVSIERDSTDLGSGGFGIAYGQPSIVTAGITITDFPGDISPHTYSATYSIDASTAIATFTPSPISYLLVEEISQ